MISLISAISPMVLVRYFSHTYLDEELLETMLVE